MSVVAIEDFIRIEERHEVIINQSKIVSFGFYRHLLSKLLLSNYEYKTADSFENLNIIRIYADVNETVKQMKLTH